MAYVAPINRTTGDLISSSIWNQDVVANVAAIFGGAMGIASQAAGDVITASSATQLSRTKTPAINGLQFPATQVPSADANMLDDYEEGSWTPVLTADVPGNISVTYATNGQLGRYVKVGTLVAVTCNIETTAFTHTTASGDALVSGLPFTSLNVTGLKTPGSSMQFHGISKANYTQFLPELGPNASHVRFMASAQGQTNSAVTIAQVPSGGNVLLFFTLTYRAAN